MEKPRLSNRALLNLSVANLGTAIAFALQQGNMSRIFQTLGAQLDALPILMVAGPVTGLIVQPLVGHYSDRTWGRFGRRRPYFVAGALVAAFALVFMPGAAALWVAAALLWLLDAALNVTIEPFRAFVGDMVPAAQRAKGFAYNTMLGCSGAVLGSFAPIAMSWADVPNVAAAGVIPPSVRYAFYAAAAILLLCVGWTVATTREYPPGRFGEPRAMDDAPKPLVRPTDGLPWLIGGALATAGIWSAAIDYQLYILTVGAMLFGLAKLVNARSAGEGAIAHILSDLSTMPKAMRRLAVTQFFTWFALFTMWTFTTPIVTQYAFGATDTTSLAYNRGADWVGLLFVAYNAASALVALLALPRLAARIGAARTHMLCLAIGAASYLLVMAIDDPNWLFLPYAGLGIAWASLLTMPYVILTDALPQEKYGVYMGIFNFFIVLPQLVVAVSLGPVLNAFFPGEPIWTMLIAATAMALASLSMLGFGAAARQPD